MKPSNIRNSKPKNVILQLMCVTKQRRLLEFHCRVFTIPKHPIINPLWVFSFLPFQPKCAQKRKAFIMLSKPFHTLTSFTIFLIVLLYPFIVSSTFTITNNCPFTIWPGMLSGSGTPPLSTTGFQLNSGKSVSLNAVPGWSGRIWARTGCQFDKTGTGKCLTGDCGGKLECAGSGATPPASLFEITLGQGNSKDFYDVSLVDGYNLPLVAWPTGVEGSNCNATGCASDLNMGCPKELQVVGEDGGQGGVVACKSACEAFGKDQYCCAGQFGNPSTCQPTYYSTVFKRACPRAYSYAYDDGTSTFTCKASNYAIYFCPKATAATNKPNGGTAMSPPSVTSSSPPNGGTTMSPPSFTYNSPPIGYDTPPSFTGNSAPPFEKQSNEGSEGEISSSHTMLPYTLYILLVLLSLLQMT